MLNTVTGGLNPYDALKTGRGSCTLKSLKSSQLKVGRKEKQITLLEILTIVQERKGKMESVHAALLGMGLLCCSLSFFSHFLADLC